MEIATLLSEFRAARLLDTEAPFLWSDVELLAYLDQAQMEYFALTGWIIDDYSPFTTVGITTGTSSIRRDASIVRVLDAVLLSTQRSLKLVVGLPIVKNTGEIHAMAVGQRTGRFVFDAIAAQDDTLRLRVERAPISTVCSLSDELEVPERHQRTLFDYMEYQAYKKPDNDTQDVRRSMAAFAQFEARCTGFKAEISRGRTPVLVTKYGGY